MLILSGCNQH